MAERALGILQERHRRPHIPFAGPRTILDKHGDIERAPAHLERHLLALLLLLLYAWSLWKGLDAASPLGGLVALMIGYYFGEAAGRRGPGPLADLPKAADGGHVATQQPCTTEGIKAVGAPPGAEKDGQ